MSEAEAPCKYEGPEFAGTVEGRISAILREHEIQPTDELVRKLADLAY